MNYKVTEAMSVQKVPQLEILIVLLPCVYVCIYECSCFRFLCVGERDYVRMCTHMYVNVDHQEPSTLFTEIGSLTD